MLLRNPVCLHSLLANVMGLHGWAYMVMACFEHQNPFKAGKHLLLHLKSRGPRTSKPLCPVRWTQVCPLGSLTRTISACRVKPSIRRRVQEKRLCSCKKFKCLIQWDFSWFIRRGSRERLCPSRLMLIPKCAQESQGGPPAWTGLDKC